MCFKENASFRQKGSVHTTGRFTDTYLLQGCCISSCAGVCFIIDNTLTANQELLIIFCLLLHLSIKLTEDRTDCIPPNKRKRLRTDAS